MRKTIFGILIIVILSLVVYSLDTPPPLSIGFLDKLYCRFGGDCEFDNLIVQNLTTVNNYNVSGDIIINDDYGRSFTTIYVNNTTTYYENNESGEHSFVGGLDLNNHNVSNILTTFYNITGCNEHDIELVEGQVCWSEVHHTLNVGTGYGNVWQVGQELGDIGVNKDSVDLNDGTIVAMYGVQGQRPGFIRADATNLTKSSMLGVLTTTCLQNQECPVIVFGIVHGLDTSIWSAETKLYINASSPGEFTSTLPTLPNNPTWVATVLNSHPTHGEIFVFPKMDTSDGFLANNGWFTNNLYVENNLTVKTMTMYDNGTHVVFES